jgi:putative SOS response-associated peptidase YedK
VPVDGFYEWKKTVTGKQPYAIALADRGLMALAGLWENWRSPAGEWMRSFAVITTTPNELYAELHNRMPVVLKPEALAGLAWRGNSRPVRTQVPARAVSVGGNDRLACERTGRKRQV